MMNPINNNEQQQLMNLHDNNQENIMVNNKVEHDDQIQNISGAGINNDILLLLYSTYPDYGNNNYYIFQEDNSSWERTISGYDDLSALRNPVEPTYQHDQSDNIIF